GDKWPAMTCGVGRTPTTALFEMFIWPPWVMLTFTNIVTSVPARADPYGHGQPCRARKQVRHLEEFVGIRFRGLLHGFRLLTPSQRAQRPFSRRRSWVSDRSRSRA